MNVKVLVAGLVITVPLVILLAVGFNYDPRSVASPLVGKPAPAFVLTRLDGQGEVKLPELRGRVVVVNFWATWCVPCRQEHPYLLALSKRYAGQVDFYGVVYQDQPATIEAWLQRYGAAYPTLIDEGGKAAIAFGVYGVPETYVIDREGIIVEKVTGPINPDAMITLLDGMVAG